MSEMNGERVMPDDTTIPQSKNQPNAQSPDADVEGAFSQMLIDTMLPSSVDMELEQELVSEE
jgi:hypothetical protein